MGLPDDPMRLSMLKPGRNEARPLLPPETAGLACTDLCDSLR